LLEDRLLKAKERLEEIRESVKALCEPVEPPKDQQAFFRYFSAKDSGNAEQLTENEGKRLSLYKHVAALVRAYANLASEMLEAGYSVKEVDAIKEEVKYYENLRDEVKKHSGDAIDLKSYEPAMRHLIDSYIRAEESEKMSEFDDMSLIQLIVERGADAVDVLPEGIKKNPDAVAETIENNVRKLIIDENPINPKYYEKMSELLDELIEVRRKNAISYQEYLDKIVELTRKAKNPTSGSTYPTTVNTIAKKSLYDNLDKDEALALDVDKAVHNSRQDDWRGNSMKTKKVKIAIKAVLGENDPRVDDVLDLVASQDEY
jgi:type I restriction enzyme R subunit